MRRTLHLRRPRVRTLEIFKREAALIGAQGGEVPAVGADPEARGLERLSEGDTLEGGPRPERPRRAPALRHLRGRPSRRETRSAARTCATACGGTRASTTPNPRGLEDDRQARSGRPIVVLQARAR